MCKVDRVLAVEYCNAHPSSDNLYPSFDFVETIAGSEEVTGKLA